MQPRKTPPAKSSGSAAGRTAAGLVPVAVSLVASAVLNPSASPPSASIAPTAETVVAGAPASIKCEDDIENFHGCHPKYSTGCSGSGRYDGYLNFLKNQMPARNVTPVRTLASLADYQDLERRTPKNLGKSNHYDVREQLTAMGEGEPYSVIGYLYYAKQEGAESSNCELTAPADTDYHIGIGFDKDPKSSGAALEKSAVVVEMTPQYRANLAPEWNLDELKKVVGKQVRVVGQLMADNEHNVPDNNCGMAGATSQCWRASIWELHPVTSFQVCTTDSCTASGPGWQDLGAK